MKNIEYEIIDLITLSTKRSPSSSSKKKISFEYPFSKTWVYACYILAPLTIFFAIYFLWDADPVEIFSFPVHPIFFYFIFTSVFTVIIFKLKLYLYSRGEGKEPYEGHLIGAEEEGQSSFNQWILILLLILTFAAFFTPIILSFLLGPLWSFIAIAGFVPAMTIPEIILFTYSQRRK